MVRLHFTSRDVFVTNIDADNVARVFVRKSPTRCLEWAVSNKELDQATSSTKSWRSDHQSSESTVKSVFSSCSGGSYCKVDIFRSRNGVLMQSDAKSGCQNGYIGLSYTFEKWGNDPPPLPSPQFRSLILCAQVRLCCVILMWLT